MDSPNEPADLEQMLDRFSQAEGNQDKTVRVRDVVSSIGRRSFGPLLLFPGIITLLPVVGDIPGVPTVMAAVVFIVAGQLILGRRYFWLPNWLLDRFVEKQKFHKAIKWMRPPAKFLDRFLRPRLTVFTKGIGTYAIAIACILIALAMPPMEVVPFTANGAGLALTLFGLSLMARDGLLALLAFAFMAVTLGFIFYYFL
ncbi:exopolysaccharide biosynthesis protein [Halomonas sp. ZH2S]|uniref:Exopolysaccharide biosynthesis protein n=1 Tax=Vreelandella zhuhanensis TaxID=2684210 RepID=A0A7X3GZ22_9GAMM|nr:exopolysaccharide biosynthesis protein [Halomonas zhuhanensis]MWJ27536.1 exopolysaccharide biosynthesis protein [Halomonas zhuhanensis]